MAAFMKMNDINKWKSGSSVAKVGHQIDPLAGRVLDKASDVNEAVVPPLSPKPTLRGIWMRKYYTSQKTTKRK